VNTGGSVILSCNTSGASIKTLARPIDIRH
jgi:hypothetical protein